MVPWWYRRKACARLVAALVRSPGIICSAPSVMCPSVKASLVLQLAVRLTSKRLRTPALMSSGDLDSKHDENLMDRWHGLGRQTVIPRLAY